MTETLVTAIKTVATQVNQTIMDMFEHKPKYQELYDASQHLIKAGGKRVRPFIAIMATEAVGGNRLQALPVAASMELLHCFTLVHDDIMDRDDKRRGVPTVHTIWGIPLAILVGDILYAKAYAAALTSQNLQLISPARLLQILNIMTETTIAICEGQTQDMQFEERQVISENDYFEMIGKKTAVLLKSSAQAGALIGGGTQDEIRHLGRFAYSSGLAFQIIDDILGLTASEATLGKPIGSDIREGKKTLIMIHAQAHATPTQQRQLDSILGKKQASESQMQSILDLVKELGSLDYASMHARQLITQAKEELQPFQDTPAKTYLLSLADYIIDRKY
ncbi:MAG: polyprenyl synthetase family protein [Candidatus Bathyarchaeota archaeon]|nr:polyprenyl synthetase family protein [Candidatus Bathyarchaeota archaeon]